MRLTITLFLLSMFYGQTLLAYFPSESQMMNAFKNVGLEHIVVLPTTATEFTFHELNAQGESITSKPSVTDLLEANEAVYHETLSYYQDEEASMPFEAYKVTKTLVCFRKYYPVSSLGFRLTNTRTHYLSFDWKHCFVFPREIDEVLTNLQTVSEQAQ